MVRCGKPVWCMASGSPVISLFHLPNQSSGAAWEESSSCAVLSPHGYRHLQWQRLAAYRSFFQRSQCIVCLRTAGVLLASDVSISLSLAFPGMLFLKKKVSAFLLLLSRARARTQQWPKNTGIYLCIPTTKTQAAIIYRITGNITQ